jgi:hypothetical protein
MASRPRIIEKLALFARRGALTLLCSSRCVDPARCHRTLLLELIERRLSSSEREEKIDEGIEESFPASDPPAASNPTSHIVP